MKLRKTMAIMMVCTMMTATVLTAGAKETVGDVATKSTQNLVCGGMRGNFAGKIKSFFNRNDHGRLTEEQIQERKNAMIKVYAKLADVTEEEAKIAIEADKGAIRTLINEKNMDKATVQKIIKELYPDGLPGGFGHFGANARGSMHRGARGAYGFTVKAYAEVAGITVDEAIALCQETGKTLYELAEEKGLTDELKAKVKELATDFKTKFPKSTTNEDL